MESDNKTIIFREQAIEEILQRVNDYDLECLVNIAQEYMAMHLNTLNMQDLEQEYNSEMGYDQDEDYVTIMENTPTGKVLYGDNK